MAITPKIHVYLKDTLLTRDKDLDLGYTEATEPSLGYISKDMLSYFSTQGSMKDKRTDRLQIHAKTSDGEMSFIFDAGLSDHTTFMQSLTAAQKIAIFNITERIYLTPSGANIEDDLVASSTTYPGYVPETLLISTSKTNASVKLTAADTDVTDLSVPDFIKFEFQFDATNIYELTVWINNRAFYRSYPYGTISKVVFPCDASYFLDPAKYHTILDTVIEAGASVFTDSNLAISTDDHTGLYTYYTRFMGSGSTRMMPMGIFFKGKEPDSLSIREKIKEALMDTGLAQELIWQQIFPDLFVEAQYYLIPVWNNLTVRPERDIYPAIAPLSYAYDLSHTLFPDYDTSLVANRLEVIRNDYSEILVLSLASPMNKNGFSLREVHPTYNGHLASQPGFMWMDEKSRDLSLRIAQGLAILMGAEMSNAFIRVEVDGRIWFSFISYGIEYYMLSKESFPFEEYPVL